MLSFVFSVVKCALGWKQSLETNLDNINEAIARIEDAKDQDIACKEETFTGEGCYYTTGSVTFVNEQYVLVDDRYMCEMINILVDNLKVNDKVHYLAFQTTKDAAPKISKIMSVIDERWDDTVNIQSSTVSISTANILRRNIIGKVTKREGRGVIVEPNNIIFNLDKIHSEFIPVIGDWLKLDALVEINENMIDLTGEVLEIDGIQPLRSKLHVGIITNYNSINGTGIIEKQVIFHKGVCESGYIPCIGDKIVSESIESEQNVYTWRSVSIVPLVQVSSNPFKLCNPALPRSDVNNAEENKHGITISSDFQFTLNIQEEANLVVSIQNISHQTHVLYNCYCITKKTQSQLSLAWPMVNTVTVLNPSEASSYIFKCKAQFVGHSNECVVFDFKHFKIERTFSINVNAVNISTEQISSSSDKRNMRIPTSVELDQSSYIPGIRPCKPPAFIKIRNGVFKVPSYFWEAVLSSIKENKTHIENEIAIGNAIPCLLKGLSFENYKDRFHALLYLEEIERTLQMQQYDIDSTRMRHSGEYLVLQVNGLVDKRPTLLVGDRAIISCACDNIRGILKYEGFIHKIGSTHLYLKFNQAFHDKYNNQECQVSFKCSHSAIQRCHNAVNLTMSRLGRQLLFPTQVYEKDFQLNVEEATQEELLQKHCKHKRSESIASSSFNTSITSTSEGSCDSIAKSPPKLSVAERLFNVKPSEQCFNASEESSICSRKKLSTDIGIPCNTQSNETLSSTSSTNVITEPTTLQPEFKDNIGDLKKRKLIWFNNDLNYYQKEAVRNVLKGIARPLPYVIFGPPGTGKTVTLCETILQILTLAPESRLLVATPSNSSANLLTERLLGSDILKPGDLVRLIAHHCLEGDAIPEKLLPYCATANLAAPGTQNTCEQYQKGVKLNCVMNVLGRHRITVGTCVALGILHNMGFARGHFSHVLVDEAGQATEPEIMIALNFIHSDCGQVVLAGDPLQLGPVVQSKLAKHYGLGESFLSRLLHQFPYQRDPEGFETCYDPRLVTKLVMNYRSLPEILELSNSLFYDSELEPQISSKKSREAKLLQLLSADLPEREGLPPAVIFHGVKGENSRDSDTFSWYNPAEATQAYLYLLNLYKRGLIADDIGIITPYQKQVHQIRDLLLELNIECPKISSVEGFQGQERNVIILSTVRSSTNQINEDIRNALGFVASPKRLNVAITRARVLLIIIGNPQTLARDPYWRSVLIYCIDHHAYTGCNFLPSDMDNFLTNVNDSIIT